MVKTAFHEGASGSCNLSKYSGSNATDGKNLHPEDGVIYEAPNGEVTLEYIYGAAAFHNAFGYFYYKDNFTKEEILKAPKFLLMLDASPWSNTKRLDEHSDNYVVWSEMDRYHNPDYRDNKTDPFGWRADGFMNYGGMLPADDIRAWEENKAVKDFKYKPSFHKLIYYPIKEDKTLDLEHPTYKFEKGVKIGFFILCHGYQKIVRHGKNDGIQGDVLQNDVRFSIPWMNEAFGNKFSTNHPNAAFNNNDPMMSFVNYRWNGVSVMGVEDGTYGESDHDMNDILFFVHGVEDDSPNFETYPYAQSWVVACEDLGSTYDFDFNDMVFGVSYVATDETNRKVYIKALAAGGTMPIELYRNRVKLQEGKKHWNHWFGESDHSVVINASGSGVKEGDEFEITLEKDEEFSLTSALFRPGVDENAKAMGGFSVRVNGKTWVKPVGAEGYAPQMMLLPVGWSWPTEHTPIYEAYPGNGADIPGFRDWYHSGDYTIWNKLTPADGKVFKHDWKGHPIENK